MAKFSPHGGGHGGGSKKGHHIAHSSAATYADRKNIAIARAAAAATPRSPAQRAASRRNLAKAHQKQKGKHFKADAHQLAADRRNLARAHAAYKKHHSLTAHDISVDIANLKNGSRKWHMERVGNTTAGVTSRGRLKIKFRHNYTKGMHKGTIHFKKNYHLGIVTHYWGFKATAKTRLTPKTTTVKAHRPRKHIHAKAPRLKSATPSSPKMRKFMPW